jgi:hypothetical protein
MTKRNTYPEPWVTKCQIDTSFTHFLSSNTECVTKWYSITLQNNSWGRGGGRYENLGVHNLIPGLLKELWGCTHPQFRHPLMVTVSLSKLEFLPWGIILSSFLEAKLTCLILTILNECIIFVVLYTIWSTNLLCICDAIVLKSKKRKDTCAVIEGHKQSLAFSK